MTGWSNLKDKSCIQQCNETLKSEELKLQSDFDNLVSGYLSGSSGGDCLKPLPPRLGNGHCIDLLKLYFVVKHKGGFEAISEKNLWGEVSLECGLGSGFGSAFKLIYAKYLSSLASYLVRLDKEKTLESNLLMELERDYRAYVSKNMDVKRESDGSCNFKLEKSGISFIDLTDEDDENESEKFVMDFADSEGSNEGNDESVKLKPLNAKRCFVDAGKSTVMSKQQKNATSCKDAGDSTEGNVESIDLNQLNFAMDSANDEGIIVEDHGYENLKHVKSEISCVDSISLVAGDVVKSSENSVASKKYSTKYKNDGIMNVDSGVSKEVSSHKRKWDCFSGMLQWMVNVAKDPTDPVIGEIPECRDWASYGNDHSWKQALLARESLFSRRIQRSTVQFGCQKKLKLHTSIARPRQRLEARLDMQPTASIYTSRPQQRIPVGRAFQVQVPKWTGVTLESDPKWLGTKTWPLEKTENRHLIERDPLGKGRTDNCGCQFPSSTECVKFHVSERRMKTRFELGSAFYAWNFDKMGEECSVAWTIEEEKKFRSIVKENPQSSQKCFWKSMCEALPKKRWTDQVNYYYNVFMLRRRGYQNRHYPSDIDSGDDETEYRSTNNSVRHGTA